MVSCRLCGEDMKRVKSDENLDYRLTDNGEKLLLGGTLCVPIVFSGTYSFVSQPTRPHFLIETARVKHLIAWYIMLLLITADRIYGLQTEEGPTFRQYA